LQVGVEYRAPRWWQLSLAALGWWLGVGPAAHYATAGYVTAPGNFLPESPQMAAALAFAVLVLPFAYSYLSASMGFRREARIAG
jgi:hypothetical protein